MRINNLGSGGSKGGNNQVKLMYIKKYLKVIMRSSE